MVPVVIGLREAPVVISTGGLEFRGPGSVTAGSVVILRVKDSPAETKPIPGDNPRGLAMALRVGARGLITLRVGARGLATARGAPVRGLTTVRASTHLRIFPPSEGGDMLHNKITIRAGEGTRN